MFFVDFAAAPLQLFFVPFVAFFLPSRVSWWYLLSAPFSEGRARAALRYFRAN